MRDTEATMRDDAPGLVQAVSETVARASDLIQLEFRVFRAEHFTFAHREIAALDGDAIDCADEAGLLGPIFLTVR